MLSERDAIWAKLLQTGLFTFASVAAVGAVGIKLFEGWSIRTRARTQSQLHSPLHTSAHSVVLYSKLHSELHENVPVGYFLEKDRNDSKQSLLEKYCKLRRYKTTIPSHKQGRKRISF